MLPKLKLKLTVILAAIEVLFTVLKGSFLQLSGKGAYAAGVVWLCYLVESGLGLALTVLLARTVWGIRDPTNHVRIGTVIICVAEVGSIVTEGSLILTKLRGDSREDVKDKHKGVERRLVAKWLALVFNTGLMLVSVLDRRGADTLTTARTAVSATLLGLYLLIGAVSVLASRHTGLRSVLALVTMGLGLSFAVVVTLGGWFYTDKFPHGYFQFQVNVIGSVFSMAVGMFLIFVAAWGLPDPIDAGDDLRSHALLFETAALALAGPAATIAMTEKSQPEAREFLISVVPQGCAIVVPLGMSLLRRFAKRDGILQDEQHC